jgi:hypothetical protein
MQLKNPKKNQGVQLDNRTTFCRKYLDKGLRRRVVGFPLALKLINRLASYIWRANEHAQG